MADDGHERRSPRFDRIGASDPRQTSAQDRDGEGKEALYSTSPRARPSAPVVVRCERCEVERGLSLAAVVRVLLPPSLVRPLARRVWSRCPTCGRYAWLDLRQGQALRSLLSQIPWRRE